jgi:hypothetical protein
MDENWPRGQNTIWHRDCSLLKLYLTDPPPIQKKIAFINKNRNFFYWQLLLYLKSNWSPLYCSCTTFIIVFWQHWP